MTRSSRRRPPEIATDAALTEGAGEIQLRRVAGYMFGMFGYMKQQAPKGVPETLADRSGA